jgi:hypothetical protein
MHGAAVVATDIDILLQKQQSTALQALQLSAAFSSWRAWTAARVTARSRYRTVKQRLAGLKQQQALAAWHAAAEKQGVAAAVMIVLQQRQRHRMLAQAFKGWLELHTGLQLQQSKVALAVLWSARVVCARVFVVWTGVARRAGAIKAAVDDRTGSSDGAAGSFTNCSSSFAVSLQQQQAWKASMQGAVKAAMQRHDEAAAAADNSVAEVNCQLPNARAAVALILQEQQQRRQQRAAEQVRQIEKQAAALAAAAGSLQMPANQLSADLSAESSGSSWLSICASSQSEEAEQKAAETAAAEAGEEAALHALDMEPTTAASLVQQCTRHEMHHAAAQHAQVQRQQQQQQQQQRGRQQMQSDHCQSMHARVGSFQEHSGSAAAPAGAAHAQHTASALEAAEDADEAEGSPCALGLINPGNSGQQSLAGLLQGQQLQRSAACDGSFADDAEGAEPNTQRQQQQHAVRNDESAGAAQGSYTACNTHLSGGSVGVARSTAKHESDKDAGALSLQLRKQQLVQQQQQQRADPGWTIKAFSSTGSRRSSSSDSSEAEGLLQLQPGITAQDCSPHGVAEKAQGVIQQVAAATGQLYAAAAEGGGKESGVRLQSSLSGERGQQVAAQQLPQSINRRQQQLQHVGNTGSGRPGCRQSSATGTAAVGPEEPIADEHDHILDSRQVTVRGAVRSAAGSLPVLPQLPHAADAVASVSRRHSFSQLSGHESGVIDAGYDDASSLASAARAQTSPMERSTAATTTAAAAAGVSELGRTHAAEQFSPPAEALQQHSSTFQPLGHTTGHQQPQLLPARSSRRRASDAVEHFACRKLCSRVLLGLQMLVQQRQQQQHAAAEQYQQALRRKALRVWVAKVQQLRDGGSVVVIR